MFRLGFTSPLRNAHKLVLVRPAMSTPKQLAVTIVQPIASQNNSRRRYFSTPTATAAAVAATASPTLVLAVEESSIVAASAAATASSTLPPALVTLLSVAPPVCFLFLQASGMKTIAEIKRTQTTGQMSVLPFLALATNCITWSLYGLLMNDMTVLLPNLSGVLFGLYQTAVFAKYSPTPLTNYYAISGAIVAGVAGAAALLPAATAATVIGLTGSSAAIFMMASPLAVIKTVIRDKSTAALPFITSFGVFVNSLAWTSYGWFVAHDPMIYGPNMLGFAAAVVQLSLFAIYPSPPAAKSAEPGV